MENNDINNKESTKIHGDSNQVTNTININNGLQIKDALEIATRLFDDNFPKLREEALNCVNSRIEMFLSEFREKLVHSGSDYSAFSKPDYQYSLLDSMKEYAKYGTDYLLNILTDIMCSRNENDGNLRIKVAIDDAIKLATKLDQNMLNFISVVFYVKHTLYHGEYTIEEIVTLYNGIYDLFPFSNINHQYLNSIGCYSLNIGTAYEALSKRYKVDKKSLENLLNNNYKHIPGDYGLTYPAIVLAVQNINRVTSNSLDLSIWIK